MLKYLERLYRFLKGLFMKELQHQIDILLSQTNPSPELLKSFSDEKFIFPFSLEGKKLAYLLSNGMITYDQYLTLHKEYTARNKYLDLFEMAPRTFGETWGETHILSLFPEFIKATKESMALCYPVFDGEFDLLLDGIRVEVKACRANSNKTKGSLVSRAYLHKEATAASFKYHYQQLKPSCCDVFIWIGVCRDELLYWVLTGEELLQTGKFATQHRNEKTGIADGAIFEGQVFIGEEDLEKFRVDEKDIVQAIHKKYFKN